MLLSIFDTLQPKSKTIKTLVYLVYSSYTSVNLYTLHCSNIHFELRGQILHINQTLFLNLLGSNKKFPILPSVIKRLLTRFHLAGVERIMC